MPVEKNLSCDVGFIGLGVMGHNLVLNMADNGYKLACFDIDSKKISDIETKDSSERGDKPQRVFAVKSYTELLDSLTNPHLIVLSVPAGEQVDHVCEHLISAGIGEDDIVIDTGNSLWSDTIAREAKYKEKFIFFSSAVSGGEVGARFGPALMPSGDAYAWTRIEPIWNAIAAKVDPDTGLPIERFEIGNPVKEGEPCTTYIGGSGSGNYVKMVHNGIEYADMQLICEAYHLLRCVLNITPKQIAEIFREWNKGVLDSYLMSITAEVLDETLDDGKPLVDIILDKAGQKGTGLWTAVSSLELGSPAASIAQAVFARSISSLKAERVNASEILKGPESDFISEEKERESFIQTVHDALYCSKICAYAQGFQVMKIASVEYGWQLDFASIAKIWRAGCIIRAVFLQSITDAYRRNSELTNLLVDPFFSQQINLLQVNWRKAIAAATLRGVPFGAMSSALTYYDSYRTKTLPANLLQGQRDFFGAHTFQRIDDPSGKKYHIEWSSAERAIKPVG